VHKGSTQTNKRSKLGFKSKGAKEPKSALVWRTGLSGVPPDSVRCIRIVQVQTRHLRVSGAALRYNSPDCPVCHRTIRCAKRSNGYQRTVDCNGHLQTLQCADSSRRSQLEAHRTVNSTCPVRHRTVRCHKKTKLQWLKPPEP
jgi:hypothetical protein